MAIGWGLLCVALVVIILAILVAAVLSRGRRRRGVSGGAEREATVAHEHRSHPLGVALEQYARNLGPEDAVGPHPLDRDRYETPAAVEGGAAGARKHWTELESWRDLIKDKKASDQYLADRAAVINNPTLDWSQVLAEMGPKLSENREYIGLINLDADGKTLKIVAYEQSPNIAGYEESETAFASVPSELVAKYASRPALIIFHTHPSDVRGDPLPSQHDLATCIHQSAWANFAANAVISRYGVVMFGLSWAGYRALNEAKDSRLARLNFTHDVVAAHEAMRSWSSFTLQDHLAFYARHRLFAYVFPSPEMVGDSHRLSFIGNLEAPIDHEIIEDYRKAIAEHREQKKQKTPKRKAQGSHVIPIEMS
jgi:proteasome lid subunit RPN8/RPN11